MRIVIVGGGKTGTFLAEELKREHEIVLVEQRGDRVEYLNSALPDIEIIEGDACEPLVLEAAGAAKADLVAAVTGDDEDNLVVAMLAKVLSEAKVYARVNHPSNQWLFDREWGVDVAVSSPAVLYGLIGKDLGLGDIVTLLSLQAENVTVREIRLPQDAAAVGKKLADIVLPGNVTVMVVLAAEGGVRAARGETVLAGDDQLLLLAEGEIDQRAIRSAFGCSSESCDVELPEGE